MSVRECMLVLRLFFFSYSPTKNNRTMCLAFRCVRLCELGSKNPE